MLVCIARTIQVYGQMGKLLLKEDSELCLIDQVFRLGQNLSVSISLKDKKIDFRFLDDWTGDFARRGSARIEKQHRIRCRLENDSRSL